MSRFYLLGAQEAVVGNMRRRLRAGQTVADSAGNALPGDVLAPGLAQSPNDRLVPLDAAAVSAMQAAGFANAAIGKPLSGQTTGADSIDA
jgi:hypothetical protein